MLGLWRGGNPLVGLSVLCHFSWPPWTNRLACLGPVSDSLDSSVQCPRFGTPFLLFAVTLYLWSPPCHLRLTGSAHCGSPDRRSAGSLSIEQRPLPGSSFPHGSWRGLSRGVACGDRSVCDLASQYSPRFDFGQLVPNTRYLLPNESWHLSDEPGTDGDRAHISKSVWSRVAGGRVSADARRDVWGTHSVWGTRGLLQSWQHNRPQWHGAGGRIQWLVSQRGDGHVRSASWLLPRGRLSDLSDRWLSWRNVSW